MVADAAPPADYDPEDDFAIQIWDAAAKKIRNSTGEIEVPLQASPGFATISASGEEWRVYTLGDARRTVQVAQRMVVRQELAESAAIAAAAPILTVIPLTWLVIGWSLGGVMGSWRSLRRRSPIAAAIARNLSPSRECRGR
ncbi:MAG: sensor histidine kinase N-terminal domain-containing protein [Alphaproteobacteria bacterium]|nr:sensor histidine kinase N-terminal domain-containing protein [Afipia sp.]MBN9499557.1 sensor histidine kinase N-terminal domain-containing protein [Alphaproteobacteria bacterium]